ncbi:hypothetical protein FRACYDRAFT_154303, partial [Fragilariopsis cylindrus CCMP1102]
IKVGQYATVERSYKSEDVDNFGRLIQDFNPLHSSSSSSTSSTLVHGIFVSSIFSSMFANIAPGCVYINQSLDFISPIFVHDIIIGCISIEKIRRRRSGDGIVVQCQTRVYKYKD